MRDLETKLRCPNCSRSIPLKLREIIPGSSKPCPHGCGATLKFQGDDGRKMQRAIDDLSWTMRRIGARSR